jgi:hypothetical protein
MGLYGQADKNMAEMQSLMPAITAATHKQSEEFCASRMQMPACQELQRLKAEAKAAGAPL